jgi:signal transduction histidine kinase
VSQAEPHGPRVNSIGAPDPFPADGEIAQLLRAMDWAASPLGPPERWPQSLRTIVRVLLTSRFAMWLGWGPELSFFYNEAYRRATLGAKHPWALGRPSSEVWAEIWPDVQGRIESVLRTGQATWDEDLLLFLERNGYREETYHTFSYSPVMDDSGAIRGNLCVVTEETDRVIGERRLALLREAAAEIAGTNSEPELFAAIGNSLEGSPDLPFTLTYLVDEAGTSARLAHATSFTAAHPAAPATLALDSADAIWPLTVALGPGGAVVDLAQLPGDLPTGRWDAPPRQALVLPLRQSGQTGLAGFFIAALNPFRPLDDGNRSFVELFAGQLAAGLANVQAYEAERQRAEALAAIDRAKTAFFSNVSHEFRTPLTLLLGPLADARDAERMPADVVRQLDVAWRNGRRLLKLVNTLLDFSRIEAGRVQARFEAVDLCALTSDLASVFRSAMESAGLAFDVVCDGPVGPVYVDRDMWEKVILNLISNAFKFTLRGGVRVTVGSDGTRARVAVQDTGHGIPPPELPRVFDRFHRVEGVPGRSHEGSGIGLALVQELVRLHGGDIAVESTVGQGTTFTVTLPYGRAHLPPDQVVESAGRTPTGTASTFVEEALRWLPEGGAAGRAPAREAGPDAPTDAALEPGDILLADDSADMRDYVRRLLAERWRVRTAANGFEALTAARQRRPDVVITDVMMPELDGFGLLRALREDPDLAGTPVIMLSARAGEEARLEGLAATADDYLVKPFSARDLQARVELQLIKARARDIERHHAERLRQLFAHAPVAIAVLTGPTYVFELANSRYQDLIGQRQVLGLPIREALPELAGQEIYELLDRVRGTGEPFIGASVAVTLNRGPDGQPEECRFDFVYQPLFEADGTVGSIVVIAHDVSALAVAKQEAEMSNRLKDEFLATLSHELRTPLNAVLGYTQMLRGGVIAADRVPAILETIERNAKLQEQLISDVLDVSRIITGKLRIDVRPVDLGAVIQEAIDTVSPAALAKGVRLQRTLDQPGVPVAGDAQRLQQVIWNLLSNAIKFTPRGGRVQVRMARVNSHVEVTVSDTGEGVAPEFLPHLFARFRQADSTFTRAHGGLGLGLAISRHLVEAHGGHIEARSPGKGRGTTFRVELPLMIVHDDSPEAVARVHPAIELASPRELTLTDLTGVRVLLVDDDRDALLMARDVLVAAGAEVATASHAEAALDALDGQAFDAAVLDIGLPGVDGYELLRRIRARPRGRQGRIPAAALTAYARPTDRTRSLQAGFLIHLSKPVQPHELAAAVQALAGSNRQADA